MCLVTKSINAACDFRNQTNNAIIHITETITPALYFPKVQSKAKKKHLLNDNYSVTGLKLPVKTRSYSFFYGKFKCLATKMLTVFVPLQL